MALPTLDSSTILTFLALALTVLLYLAKRMSPKSKPNLPPGPPCWPVVGNLFQVAFSGKSFMHYVRDLRPAYGPIFTLRMGTRTLIVISSAELAHEALIEKGQFFASRPAENPTRRIFSCNKFTVNSAVYGQEWRSLRRNMVSGMLSSTRLKDFRPVRDSTMDRFIERIKTEAEANDGSVWVLRNARFAVFCILLSMCFGLDLDEATITKVDHVLKKVLMVLLPRIDDYLPLLSPFFSKQRKQALDVRREEIATLLPLIEKRRSIVKNPMKLAGNDGVSYCYLDSLFDLKVEGRKSAPSNEELVTLCAELLNGGTDTTATAIEWAIARLIENPSIQSKLHDEIIAVVGDNNRKVDEKDTEKMVYLQAFVKELLRRHPPSYFSLTHAAIEPATLGGYDIPTSANVDFYLPGISEDPGLWREPKKFDPERFVTGEETADMTGVTGVRMIPFGAGRRICPGLGMGTTHIGLMVARMVQEFEWLEHPQQPTVDLADKLEFTVVMNRPLLATVRARN